MLPANWNGNFLAHGERLFPSEIDENDSYQAKQNDYYVQKLSMETFRKNLAKRFFLHLGNRDVTKH